MIVSDFWLCFVFETEITPVKLPELFWVFCCVESKKSEDEDIELLVI